jgi:predicted RNA-binding protein with PUA-like domain
MSQQQSQQENQLDANNNNGDNTKPEILEQGDIYFFYRPKKNAEEVKGIADVRRFSWLLPLKNQKE